MGLEVVAPAPDSSSGAAQHHQHDAHDEEESTEVVEELDAQKVAEHEQDDPENDHSASTSCNTAS